MTIRTATMNDLNAITAVEAECFPAAEAASREEFSKRLTYYNDHFWLMFDEDKLIAFVDGFVTDEETLTDEMFHDASLHNPNGEWQTYSGAVTIKKNIELFARYIDENGYWSISGSFAVSNITKAPSEDAKPVIPNWFSPDTLTTCWYNWDWRYGAGLLFIA